MKADHIRMFQTAVDNQRAGKLVEATKLCRRIVARSPNNFDPIYFLGVLYAQQEKFDAAVSMFRRAAKLRPDAIDVIYNLSVALNFAGASEEAANLFKQIFEMDSSHIPARNNYATYLLTKERPREALEQYDSIISLRPDLAEAYLNRAVALKKLDRIEEAILDCEKALALQPNFAEAHLNRGNLLINLGRSDDAFTAFENALKIRSDFADVWLCRGNALLALARYDEALDSYENLKSLQPHSAEAWRLAGRTQFLKGNTREGIDNFDRARQLGADANAIAFELARFGAGKTPVAMPASLISDLFENYANNFETHLVQKLEYRTPILLFELVRSRRSTERLSILDLGCGTGLAGSQFHPIATSLHGVDLSSKMLEKAKERGIYDELQCSEILAYLAVQKRKYDLIVAADVLVYFGDLKRTFSLVRQALNNNNGSFCFSAEATETGQYLLQRTGRYAHSQEYLQNSAEACGFKPEIKTCILRKEGGLDVQGYIGLLSC